MQKFTCPMHPKVLKDEPGKCPLCGMVLVPLGNPGPTSHIHHSQNEIEQGAHFSSHHQGKGAQYNKHEGHHTK